MSAYHQCKVVSHARRVCSVYKKLLRALGTEDIGNEDLQEYLEPMKDNDSSLAYYYDHETEDDEE